NAHSVPRPIPTRPFPHLGEKVGYILLKNTNYLIFKIKKYPSRFFCDENHISSPRPLSCSETRKIGERFCGLLKAGIQGRTT
ncbi:hypothetical protein, partial [Dickeya fangzhongdai]|uniref:hypothetical protein n=1 Tax=Dickeya fangzhongdai TaxID=1778540 RepID=UPI001AD98E36